MSSAPSRRHVDIFYGDIKFIIWFETHDIKKSYLFFLRKFHWKEANVRSLSIATLFFEIVTILNSFQDSSIYSFRKDFKPFALFEINLSCFSHETQIERIIFTPSRTQIRNRFLRWIVSNQQNKVGKENRQNRPVPSEKGLALKERKVARRGRGNWLVNLSSVAARPECVRRRASSVLSCALLKFPI